MKKVSTLALLAAIGLAAPAHAQLNPANPSILQHEEMNQGGQEMHKDKPAASEEKKEMHKHKHKMHKEKKEKREKHLEKAKEKHEKKEHMDAPKQGQ
ncbi:MAG: hypothetical protein KGJ06_02795 [Pseudomonadota bacterium]|nr:hypothetical protein [Pseudomonadota bacterium]